MKVKHEILFNRLRFNLYLFQAICFKRLGFINKAIERLLIASNFAWNNYCGFVCNARIERLINHFGKTIISPKKYDNKKRLYENGIRVLHVISEYHEIGGHSKLMENWIRIDSGNIHEIIITRQQPDFNIENIKKLCLGKVYYLNELTYKERVTNLYIKAQDYDLIIMHHHPDDVIPSIAFSLPEVPPVLIMNHADHCYWTGSSVCDGLIQIRNAYMSIDKKRRQINQQYLFPIPVWDFEVSKLEKTSNKKIQLLTVGSAFKYNPTKIYNFFESIISVLAACPDASITIIGISPNHPLAQNYKHNRIEFIKPTKDIAKYFSSADIYVEGFPFSSFTAMLEALRYNVACQLRYKPTKINNIFINEYGNKWHYPDDIMEWQENLIELISSEKSRRESAEYFYTCVQLHNIANSQERIKTIYNSIINKVHTIKKIKKVEYKETGIEEELLHSISKSLKIFYPEPNLPFNKWS